MPQAEVIPQKNFSNHWVLRLCYTKEWKQFVCVVILMPDVTSSDIQIPERVIMDFTINTHGTAIVRITKIDGYVYVKWKGKGLIYLYFFSRL